MLAKDECVRVVVRCRPMDKKETEANYERVIDMDVKRGAVSIRKPGGSQDVPKEFFYDAVYDWK